MLGSNKRLLSALRRVRVAQLPVPTRYANARMRKIDTSLQQKHTPRGGGPKEYSFEHLFGRYYSQVGFDGKVRLEIFLLDRQTR